MFNLNFYLISFWFFFIFSLLGFYLSLVFIYMDYSIFMEMKIFSLNSLFIYYIIYLDWVSLLFISCVMLISSMVIFYSIQYMGYESYSSLRFLFLVILFVFSMLLMIISPNLLSILVGWDGLGLVSYCLVIYYNSLNSYLAGLITCLTNRLGDVGLLICLCWLVNYGGWHFMFFNGLMCNSVFFLLIFSCFTKSAQIPFSCWLPAAMAAPTPVSSLVHSSTLVTAGVYLLYRFFWDLIILNSFFLFISILTMIFSSLCACYEFDLKSIIALSTLSQLGLMMSSIFMGLCDLGYFHLLTHAMFKSLLFLCSGIFIFYMMDNQDIRLMGSVCMSMPVSTSCFNISNLSLCGIPFLSGFYSKDFILESSIFGGMNFFVFMMIYISLGLTCFYSMRLFYYSMIYNNKFISLTLYSDEFNYMKLSVIFLTFMSVVFGGCFMWLMNLDLMFLILPLDLKLLTLSFVLIGFWVGYESFSFSYVFSLNYYFFNSFMWFMNSHLIYSYKLFYYFSINNEFVLNWGEYYSGYGFSYFFIYFSSLINYYFMSSFKISLLSFFIWFLLMV
uniref:NADH dehydrogenase subunit 5 n=1 Tax=Onukigallia onukii TaxID=1792642 RepID=UPI003001D6A7|nr:NADH dehydrogenase subunit 5 [Onukigallia onukii]